MKKYECPKCGQKEVEKLMACGSTTYFCNACKQMISKQQIEKDDKTV